MSTDPPWIGRWQALCDKWSREGYAALTPPERVWFNVRSLIDFAQNGGLISYDYNSGADTLPDCLTALDSLGASDVRRQVERVNALFGGSVPPSQEARNRIMDSWNDDDGRIDALLTEVDDALTSMVKELDAKLDQFLRDAAMAP